ncbi:MAG: hypothetical protein HC786_16680 [Richelia sp. CSU_2_1]|nr:hypothetical protein [Richelia sp. CSU_2_1]
MRRGGLLVAFPREARLLTPDAFTRALKTRPFRGKFLWVYRVSPITAETAPVATNSALVKPPARPQLGMMIGKRNAKTAVLRNAIKRRIREQV